MTEEQKYHGNTAKVRKPKPSANDARAMIPRKAYVEDVQDVSEGGTVAIVDVPPRAPSPPPPPGALEGRGAATPAAVNVFDFLVDETSSPAKDVAPAQQLLPTARDERVSRVHETPYNSYRFHDARHDGIHDPHYMEQGFSYGASPIAHEPGIQRYDSSLHLALEPANYTTPAPGRGSISMPDARSYYEDNGTGRRRSTNKRKRNNVEELNLARHGPLEYMEGDQVMTDAPPLLQSGLTGGLNRLLTRPDFPPSPDYSGGDGENEEATPLAPLKRSKHSKSSTRSAIDRDRGGHKPERRIVRIVKESTRKSSSESQQSNQSQSLRGGEGEHTSISRSRRRHKHHSAEPGEHRDRRDRERHRSRRDREGSEQHQSRRRRRRHSSSSPHRSNNHKTLKAIEYHGRSSRSPSNSQNGGNNGENQQLILRKTAITASASASAVGRTSQLDATAFAQLFLSFVTKGPDSEKGCSVNKALKRFHREVAAGAAAGGGVGGGGVGGSDENDGAAVGGGGGNANANANANAKNGTGSSGISSSARKAEEEKELFRALRMRRNDRGEIVVFM